VAAIDLGKLDDDNTHVSVEEKRDAEQIHAAEVKNTV
jgi:hypothetical protein